MYYDKGFNGGSDALVQQIATSNARQRLALQPQVTRMIDHMTKTGTKVPLHLRNLNDQLIEEVIEARFDNLPV